MSAKNLSVNDARCMKTGKQHASEPMAIESSEVQARWVRDQAALALYGHGPTRLAAFQALLAEHTRQREGRPEVVAEKTHAVRERQQTVEDAKTWVGRVYAGLLTLARNDLQLGGRLYEAYPDVDGELEGSIGTLATILNEVKDRLPSDFQAEARLAEVPDLQSRLATAHGTVSTAKAKRVADTAAIDLLDGKLYYMIRDLNDAARAAIRNGDLQAALAEYRFHHLGHRRRLDPDEPADSPTPAVSPIPPETPTVSPTPSPIP